jgi:hypothetical protein
MKNQLKQINKVYHKRLYRIDGLEHFVEYLRYLRDLTILNAESTEALKKNTRANTLIAAINEFEAYENAKEEKQRTFHWNSFWEFVKLNMEEWQVLNDSV